MQHFDISDNQVDFAFANEKDHFTGMLEICPNPHCHCQNIQINFLSNGDGTNKKFDTALNLGNRSIATDLLKEDCDRLLSNRFIDSLSAENWCQLEDSFALLKQKYSESYDFNKHSSSMKFDYNAIEGDGLLVYWKEVFPFETPFLLTLESGSKFVVEESYCLNPHHPCRGLGLTFLPAELIDDRIPQRPISSYDTSSFVYTSYSDPNKADQVDAGSSTSSIHNPIELKDAFFRMASISTGFFKKRHELLKKIYSLSREYYLQPSTVVRAEPKIGRNEACPCGSGKKYKKCCLGSQ